MAEQRNVLLRVCMIILVALLPALAHAQQTLPERLAARTHQLMATYRIPGVTIALVAGGKLVWSHGFGYADIEAQRPMTTDTPCRVQSISKPVTAWGVMSLVERGVFQLDEPVAKHITSWSSEHPQWQEVTIRQLLTHQSGLPIGDVMDQHAPWSEVPTVRHALSREAHGAGTPGDVFAYSNPGYNVLEVLIEDVTGLPFAEYMQETVLVPLGMLASSFTWSEDFDPASPTGYNTKGKPVPVYVYPGRASGGLFATVDDVARFLIAGMGPNPILSIDTMLRMYEPAVAVAGIYSLISPDYGMGYFLETLHPGVTAVWHGGQGNGLMTHFHSLPETGDALVVLTNSQRSWPFIGELLTIWSEELGVAAPGMTAISTWERLLQAFSVLVAALALGATLWTRLFRRKPKHKGVSSVWLPTAGMVCLSLVLWAWTRDYLFLTAVFPRGAEWFGIALVVVGLTSLASLLARMPQRHGSKTSVPSDRNVAND